MTRQQMIDEATAKIEQSRAAFNAARPGSKAWREASEDLNFWQGRRAMIPPANA